MTILKSYKALLKDGNVYDVDQVYNPRIHRQHLEYHLTRNGETKVVSYNKYWDLEPVTSDNIFKNH